jgi:hypothetical protein
VAEVHTEAWRQKLSGKGRETGRGKWATEAGKDRCRQAGNQRQAFRSRKAEAGRWADAGMKKEAGMQAVIDADTQARMDERADRQR